MIPVQPVARMRAGGVPQSSIWISNVQSKLISYLQSQRRDAQWGFLLKSLVHEASAALGPDQTRDLMFKAGMTAGREIELPECESIEQMEDAANRYWARLGLGVVSFLERNECLEIAHEGVPESPFAAEGLADFLAGVYQQWFVSLGAGERLQVRQCENADSNVFLYRLAA